ncbi:helix-turn-helix domain-containing protein [Halostreptopolyspora alba]
MSGYRPGTHQGLPGRHLRLVVSFAAPVEIVRMPDPAQSPTTVPMMVGGLHASPATIAHHGEQAGVEVALSPFGARHVLGVPAGALASTVADLAELLGSRAAHLPERLGAAAGWDERFALLDRVLGEALTTVPPAAPEVRHAWDRLVAAAGRIPVDDLAREVGWSRRHLAKRFRSEVGLAPKTAGRVLRFERSARLLRGTPGTRDLAAVAYSCGYHDQPHLNRDWRALAGRSPTEWLAEEIPNVQDSSPADPPGLGP